MAAWEAGQGRNTTGVQAEGSSIIRQSRSRSRSSSSNSNKQEEVKYW